MITSPAASTPWTRNRLGDVETDCRDRLHAWLPHNRDRPSGDHFNGTYVPMGEPSTASEAAVQRLISRQRQGRACAIPATTRRSGTTADGATRTAALPSLFCASFVAARGRR